MRKCYGNFKYSIIKICGNFEWKLSDFQVSIKKLTAEPFWKHMISSAKTPYGRSINWLFLKIERLITEVNSVIYDSKLKVFAKLHKESEIWVQKWSVLWKSEEKKVLRYFLDTLILIYEISTIFTRWFHWLFRAWKINWCIHVQCHKISGNSVEAILSYYLSFLQMILLIKMLLDSSACFLEQCHKISGNTV